MSFWEVLFLWADFLNKIANHYIETLKTSGVNNIIK